VKPFVVQPFDAPGRRAARRSRADSGGAGPGASAGTTRRARARHRVTMGAWRAGVLWDQSWIAAASTRQPPATSGTTFLIGRPCRATG